MSADFQQRVCISKKATFLSIFICLVVVGYLLFAHFASQNNKTLQSKAAGIANTVRKQEIQRGGWIPVDRSKWPFIVDVHMNSNLTTNDCTGTLIDRVWVLTARHCVGDNVQSPQNITINAYITDSTGSNTPVPIAVDQIMAYSTSQKIGGSIFKVIDPSRYTNDVVLLKLHTGIDNSTISFTSTQQLFAEGDTNMFVILNLQGNRLLQAVVPLIPRDRVDSWLGYHNMMTPDVIALGYPDGGASICNSDSGPALMWNAQMNQWVQVGIASWMDTVNCGGTAKTPDFFVNIAQYAQGIQTLTNNTPLSGSFTSVASIVTTAESTEFTTKILGWCDRRLPSCRCELDFLPDSVCPNLPTLPPEAVPSLLPLPPTLTPSPSPTPSPIVLHAL